MKDIEQSIKFEFTLLASFLFENVLDLTALLIYCLPGFRVWMIAAGLALARGLLMAAVLLAERSVVAGKNRGYFLARRTLAVCFWASVALCDYLRVSFLPVAVFLLAGAAAMLVENCNCSGDVG